SAGGSHPRPGNSRLHAAARCGQSRHQKDRVHDVCGGHTGQLQDSHERRFIDRAATLRPGDEVCIVLDESKTAPVG
ncbi:hypothetical protein, partial [Propionimicrobium lymphophilum]|uniref:hypothetical protein n=1 Tax=Propionimicrobium lymphophilum TaxID=33012 RepID=UPI00288902E2